MEHAVCFGKHRTVLEYKHTWNYRKWDWSIKYKLLNPAVKANVSFQSPQAYFQQASAIKKTFSSTFMHFLILGTCVWSVTDENIKYLFLSTFNTAFNAQVEHNNKQPCLSTYILQLEYKREPKSASIEVTQTSDRKSESSPHPHHCLISVISK